MTIEVDDFLMHYGVKGMRWGRRRSGEPREPRTPLSRKQKIAIAVGVGSTVAIGAVIALSLMDKKVNDGGGFSFGDMPVQTMTTNKTMMSGKANLIFNAAAMDTTPPRSVSDKVKNKAFDTVKNETVKKVQKMSYDDFKAMVDTQPKPRTGLIDKSKGFVTDKAKEEAIKKIRDISTAKAEEMARSKQKTKIEDLKVFKADLPKQTAKIKKNMDQGRKLDDDLMSSISDMLGQSKL